MSIAEWTDNLQSLAIFLVTLAVIIHVSGHSRR